VALPPFFAGELPPRFAAELAPLLPLLLAFEAGAPFFFGKVLRFVFARSRSFFSLMEFAMLREAPLSDPLEVSPRFAESAAPAAICCFFDFAGIQP
jgi:hypothetical protein